MSRLDDQLRNAFRREQPSADFTARVLERVALQPAPRPSWRQRLAMLVEPPKLRWIAIGVTASVLLAIGAAQYSKLSKVTVNDDLKIANGTAPPRETSHLDGRDATSAILKPAPKIKHRASSTNHRAALAQHQKRQELRDEAEAAKEKLMLALHIASAALNDAQKAVHDDGPKP